LNQKTFNSQKEFSNKSKQFDLIVNDLKNQIFLLSKENQDLKTKLDNNHSTLQMKSNEILQLKDNLQKTQIKLKKTKG
jgi:multidrug resistance efflux pump